MRGGNADANARELLANEYSYKICNRWGVYEANKIDAVYRPEIMNAFYAGFDASAKISSQEIKELKDKGESLCEHYGHALIEIAELKKKLELAKEALEDCCVCGDEKWCWACNLIKKLTNQRKG